MSLFKVCTWWSHQCPDLEENYDSESLLCVRFGLEDGEKDYIAVGSHSGHLSIFYPTTEPDSDGNLQGYKPTDLLLEAQFGAPILALTAGRFTGSLKSENTNQLAVLHPLSLAIYNLVTITGVAEHGTQSNLQLIVEHKFKRSAFGLCKGHFGQIKGREFFCIVHLDGTLTFYEQDGISYECTLPGPRALPSPTVYVPRTDSFVRINSCWELESFSYQELSHYSINKSTISPTWSLCIGEFILAMNVVQTSETCSSIMILGEHNLINIADFGKLQFMIKLDYSPKCFYTFLSGYYWEENSRLITAVVSESSTLLIYEGANLIWAAHLQEVPVAIKRSNLSNLPGGIVTLGAKGDLHVGYLGAEPLVFKVPPLNHQEMNFEKAQQELADLENEIKKAVDVDDEEVLREQAENDVKVEFEILANLEPCPYVIESDELKDKNLKMCPASFKFETRIPLEELQVVFVAPDGVLCSNQELAYTNVAENSSTYLDVWFYVADDFYVPTLQVEAVVSFINKQSIPRVVSKKSFLPLNMFFKQVAAQKDAAIKITLSINLKSHSHIPKLSCIYPEYFATADKDTQALGLSSLLSADEIVTIVFAKNSNRIRIQSDSLESIPPVLERIITYVNALRTSSSDDGGDAARKSKPTSVAKAKAIVASPHIPAKEILRRIDCHHSIQEDIRKQTDLMDALWNQFKLFQKSLQAKREGDPVDGILMLIEKNYDDLVAEGDKLLDYRKQERCKRSDLSCALSLATQIIDCFKIDTKVSKLVCSALVCPAEDWAELSWEESMAPGADMLHHFNGLTGGKATSSATKPVLAADRFDFDRFKKHISSLFERVCRLADTSKDPKAVDDFTSDVGKRKLSKQTRLEALEDAEEDDEKIVSDWVCSELPPAGVPMLIRAKSTLI